MIRDCVADLAAHMGTQVSCVPILDGRPVGCLDAYLLDIKSKDQLVSAMVHQSELNGLQSGYDGTRLELKIRASLMQLQMIMEP
jgi:hypothetical protein